MMLTLIRWPDPVLLKRCEEWNFDDPPVQADFLMADMIETMAKSGGIGLAANQVGVSYRVITMHIQETDEYIAMFNPEIVSISEHMYVAREGCLSFPRVMLDIERPKTVEATWVDRMGNNHNRTFSDIDAKCFLHEIDHLNGVTFKDHISQLKFDMAVKRAKKK
jgi:peptide deformylase